MQRVILIRPGALSRDLGIGRSTLWRWVRKGAFPKPIRIQGISGWRPEDVEAAIVEAKRKDEQ